MTNNESSKEYLISSMRLLESSESNFRKGAYEEAIYERRKAREIIGTEEEFIALIKELILNNSKYNLIADYKIRINERKRIQIMKHLKEKSDAQYNSGNYKGCIRSLRRIEKYY